MSRLLLLLLMFCGTSWTHQQNSSQIHSTVGRSEGMHLALVPNPNNINLIWDALPNISFYNITWSEVSGPRGNDLVSGQEMYTISDLLPCTDYTVSVVAMKGEVQEEKETNKTRTLPQSSFPVSFVYLHPMEDEATLNVSWNSVTSPGNCNLTYRVSWNYAFTAGDDESANITSNNNLSITELNYFTSYEVCVHPWVEGMTAVKMCEISSTVASVPEGPPRNIRVVDSTTESLMLEWEPPATPNGDITNYSVTWNPDAPSEPIITTASTYNLTGLQPCTNYTIRICAATNKGNGPPGDTSQTTLSKAPGPPTNVTVAMVLNQSDRLSVTWIQPSSTCDITSNTISWSLDKSKRVNATENYTITGLDPWTTYQVRVSASTLAGEGPYGNRTSQITDQDKPSKPENIKARTLTADTVQVKWDPPAAPNGVISHYLVTWRVGDQYNGRNTSDTEYNLTGLLPCTTYNITVNAATSKGNGPPACTEGNSSFAVPGGPPENMTITTSTMDSITVEWERPAAPNGVITNYVFFMTPNDILTHSSDTKYTATGLQPSTTYNITVTAVNCMGSSPPNSILGTTEPADRSWNAWAIVGVVLCSVVVFGGLPVMVAAVVKRIKARNDVDDDVSDTLSEFIYHVTGLRPVFSSRGKKKKNSTRNTPHQSWNGTIFEANFSTVSARK